MGKLERSGNTQNNSNTKNDSNKKNGGGPRLINEVPIIFFDHKSPRGTVIAGTENEKGEKEETKGGKKEEEEPTIIVANAALFEC